MKNTIIFQEDLPGVHTDSDIMSIYTDLKTGKVLTSLDAVKKNHTVNLPKYISILRKKYDIQICSKWITLSKKKKVKMYSIDDSRNYGNVSNII